MIKKLKRLYAKLLFERYGFREIPEIFKIIPLWSPSVYCNYQNDQISKWITEGIEQSICSFKRCVDLYYGVDISNGPDITGEEK